MYVCIGIYEKSCTSEKILIKLTEVKINSQNINSDFRCYIM